MENLIEQILERFNREYPEYKDKLKILSLDEYEMKISFYDIVHECTLKDLHHDYGLDGWSEEALLWLNITDLLSFFVNIHENKMEEKILDYAEVYGEAKVYRKAM